jgi:hypothetical protein
MLLLDGLILLKMLTNKFYEISHLFRISRNNKKIHFREPPPSVNQWESALKMRHNL